MKKTLLILIAAGCGGVPCSPIAADTVVLSRGSTFTGIITDETPTEITLKQGDGRMVISKSIIERIERDSADDRKALLETWKREYFYEENYVPPGLEEPAALFRDLKQKHAGTLSAQHQEKMITLSSQVARDRLELLKERLGVLKERLQTESETVRRLQTERNRLTLENNERIARLNAGTGRSDRSRLWEQINATRAERAELLEETQAAETRLAAVQNELNDTVLETNRESNRLKQAQQDLAELARTQSYVLPFTKAFAALQASLRTHDTPSNRKKHPWFFEGLDAGLSEMADVLQTETVAYQKESGSILVQTVLNDTVNATLILDTGASITTISEDLAARLGISLDDKPRGDVTLADGSTIPSSFVILDSVQVGTALRRDVPASVLKNPPGPGVDGLLGLSFLKYFTVHLNSESNQVELLHLSTSEE